MINVENYNMKKKPTPGVIDIIQQPGSGNDRTISNSEEFISPNEVDVGQGEIIAIILIEVMHLVFLVAMSKYGMPFDTLGQKLAFLYLVTTIVFYGGVIFGYFLNKPIPSCILNTLLPWMYSISLVSLLVIALFMPLPGNATIREGENVNTQMPFVSEPTVHYRAQKPINKPSGKPDGKK
jgi:hypothetical protein